MNRQETITNILFKLMNFSPEYKKHYIQTPAAFFEEKLTPVEVICFMQVAKIQEISMSSLSENIGISLPQLSRTIKSLISKDLVERIVDPNNRRKAIIILSQNGSEQMAKLKDKIYDCCTSRLSKLSDDDLEQCLFHLDSLSNIFNK